MADINPYKRPAYPVLIVISGPSGVGKDTIARLLLAKQDSFSFVVTATTRIQRASEVHGRDYIFLSHDEFAEMIEGGELLEWAVVYNDYKGVPKQQIQDALDSNRDVIMRVDVQGAATIRKLLPDAIFIFLTAESEESLITRLRERKSETAEGLNLRIATAREEMKRMGEFDYCVVNTQGKQNEAVDRILAIVDAEHSRVKRNQIEL
jgi:guanylate kinase